VQAVRLDDASLEALTGLGLCCKELGCLTEAQAAFKSALRVQPGNALALGNLAGLYFDQGKLEHAVLAYKRAIQLQPNFPEAYNNLGNTLRELGRADDAIACYTACIQLQFGQASAAQTAGAASGVPVVALQAQRLAVAFSNLGGILKTQGRLHDAITCYEHVATLQPALPEVQANVAAAYKDSGRHDAAITSYLRALQLKPDFPEAFANLVHSLQSVCDWRDREALFGRLQADVEHALAKDELPCVQPFHAMSYPFPAELVLDISRRYAKHYALSAAALKLGALPHPPRRPLIRGERLRIGYVSSDFANHPLSHLMASVFGMHDRTRVEVFCYALSASDGSVWRARIQAEAEHFVDVSGWATADIVRRISSDRIHIAINLNGYTKGARNEIFPLRPAPIQCSYMGFPATMGADYLPYLISDPVVAPRHLHHCYSEHLALMPHCYFINDYRQSHTDLLDDANLPSRSEFGLPEDKVIFACSNQLYKYDPDTFVTWMRILRRVPQSVLWLLRFPAYGEPRIMEEAARHGVSHDRIVFTDVAPKSVHIARSGLADVFLDTPLCNAHTTGCDVLWGGVPTLTLPLERMASRVCASLCTATGYGEEMVVHSQAEYEERAVELGMNRNKRKRLREQLKESRSVSPLFDTRRWVRNLERVFARMWHIHCTGREPQWFQITEDDPLPGDHDALQQPKETRIEGAQAPGSMSAGHESMNDSPETPPTPPQSDRSPVRREQRKGSRWDGAQHAAHQQSAAVGKWDAGHRPVRRSSRRRAVHKRLHYEMQDDGSAQLLDAVVGDQGTGRPER
jgi:protein O-GlcNAc transferase